MDALKYFKNTLSVTKSTHLVHNLGTFQVLVSTYVTGQREREKWVCSSVTIDRGTRTART